MMERQPFLLCFAAILLRCWGGVNLGVGVTGLWRRPGPSVIASDANVIKCASKRVMIQLYKARYDRTPQSVSPAGAALACGPDADPRTCD